MCCEGVCYKGDIVMMDVSWNRPRGGMICQIGIYLFWVGQWYDE